MPTSARARSPKHRKPDFPAADSLVTATEVSASTRAATASYFSADTEPTVFSADTEPTAAELDLSADPELLAIPDPADIVCTLPSAADFSDPDAVGELDPDQTITLPDGDHEPADDRHDRDDQQAGGTVRASDFPTGSAS
jgi:hypothetical protein